MVLPLTPRLFFPRFFLLLRPTPPGEQLVVSLCQPYAASPCMPAWCTLSSDKVKSQSTSGSLDHHDVHSNSRERVLTQERLQLLSVMHMRMTAVRVRRSTCARCSSWRPLVPIIVACLVAIIVEPQLVIGAIHFGFESSKVGDCALGWECMGSATIVNKSSSHALGFHLGSIGSASSSAFVLPPGAEEVEFDFIGKPPASSVFIKKQSTGATVCETTGEQPPPVVSRPVDSRVRTDGAY